MGQPKNIDLVEFSVIPTIFPNMDLELADTLNQVKIVT